MSKKNSNVILKEGFKNYKNLSYIFYSFQNQIYSFKKKNILVAVSGGPDSLALVALIKAYSYKTKSKIFYALVDHNIRKNSSNEAQSVKKLLKKHQITLNILKNKKLIDRNIQSKAREVRYELLVNFCKKKRINTILTAHNFEDQVETFFIRLSRGSGLHGLASMKQVTKLNKTITLVRPLLEFKKHDLIKISKLIFGTYYKDPTNKNTKYLRTRIRNFKKKIESIGINYDQIFKSIKNLASSRDTLEIFFNKIYKDLVIKKRNLILINVKKFNNLNQEMKMRVLNKSLKELTNSYYSPRSKKTINLINQLEMNNSNSFTLAGCVILKDKNHIIIKKIKKN
jgi:tRNA(Ile)-lysidine synthase